jgi:hypothetical protein
MRAPDDDADIVGRCVSFVVIVRLLLLLLLFGVW